MAVDAPAAEAAIWQDVEYGAYAADLPLWEDLAAAGGGPVLELGAGAGRVALELARNGHEVLAADRDADICAELLRRAEGLPVTAIEVDFEDLDASPGLSQGAPPALVVAPLHVVQQLAPGTRPALLAALAALMAPGGALAITLVDEESLVHGTPDEHSAGYAPLPDMREVDGWVYSSDPLWVQVGKEVLTVRRVRERVSPDGEIERSVHDDVLHRLTPAALAAEADAAGFSFREARPVASGPNEANSTAVILERR